MVCRCSEVRDRMVYRCSGDSGHSGVQVYRDRRYNDVQVFRG